ncbi:MAG: polysaccharide pyruvyl transferase family protein [Acidipropionibacterium sp.]|nr:polysaccharide pyruvyl transferase family protein [Acidipropionibacterium sp.]
MRLFWSDGGPMHHNFGDQLSPIIVNRVFGVPTVHSGLDSCDMLALGSILEDAEEHVSTTAPYIWGSGFIEDGGPWQGNQIHPRAVRGNLTRPRLAHLTRRTLALGDPGLLTPHAFPEYQGLPKRFPISLVPHFIDIEHPRIIDLRKNESLHMINVLDPVEEVIRQICQSRLIISSSLHGLIVADAFRIPNYRMRMVDNRWGGDYKFEDYCSAFGQSTAVTSPEDVVHNPDRYTSAWEPRTRLTDLQEGLLRAFPSTHRLPI